MGRAMTPSTVVLLVRFFSGFVDIAIGAGVIALGVYVVEHHQGGLQLRSMYVVIALSVALIAGLTISAYGAVRANWPVILCGLAAIALALVGLQMRELRLQWVGYAVGVAGAGLALWGIVLIVWNTIMLVAFGVARAASAGWNAGRDR